jgi:hypothetical protein
MPLSHRNSEPVEFGAPIGTRVRVLTLLSLAIVPLAMLFNLGLRSWLHLPPKTLLPMVLAPTIALAILLPVGFFQRVLKYRLTATELEVLRPRRVNRFPIAQLESVEADPRAMEWSLKVIGNDGLGAITGQFRNRKLGAYRALVTDRDRAVVLRWPDRTLVVSPDRPHDFVDELRLRAGLRR